MIKVNKKENKKGNNVEVYDISLDGTFVNALGGNVLHNTDGFNFQLPKVFRYTKEHPYISTGEGRNYPKGKEYVECQADVAEFENKYLSTAYNGGIQKMGLDIDEVIPASINLSRKNYIDVLDNGKIKLVGNTIKSRRLSPFIEKFFDMSLTVLAHGKGWEFLNMYYDYIEKIYNYQIPLKDIASKGKIKKTLKDYVADCETVTKAGSKKSRQAWYELALLNNLKVDLNDTIYYVNTGNKKSLSSDVKKILHQYTTINGEEVELKGKVKTDILKKWCEENEYDYKSLKTAKSKEILAPHISREWEEIILNCKMIPLSIAESEEELLCKDVGEDFEYNVEKYLEMFNKRVKPLLVCFHPDMRQNILITNPSDRKQFTENECTLVSGYPNKETDQDTYEQLMTPERKEIAFWISINQKPPFIDECQIEWDKLVNNYLEMIEKEKNVIFQEENAKYLNALKNLTDEDYKAFEDDNEIPNSILEIVDVNSDMHFYFKKLPDMRPSTGGSIIDDLLRDNYSFLDSSEIEYEMKNSLSSE